MTAIKIIRLLHLAGYLVVTSQLMYYVFVMGDALKMVSIENFVGQRKIVDPLVHLRHVPFYYACIVLSLVLLVMMYKQWSSPAYITLIIASVLLFTDIYIGTRFNGPINKFINEHAMDATGVDWESLRVKWIYYIKLRGLIIMTGFLALLAGLVFNGTGKGW